MLLTLICWVNLMVFRITLLLINSRILDDDSFTASWWPWYRPRLLLWTILRWLLMHTFELALIVRWINNSWCWWETTASLAHGLVKWTWFSHQLLVCQHLRWAKWYLRRSTGTGTFDRSFVVWWAWWLCSREMLQASLRSWCRIIFFCTQLFQFPNLLKDTLVNWNLVVAANCDYFIGDFNFFFFLCFSCIDFLGFLLLERWGLVLWGHYHSFLLLLCLQYIQWLHTCQVLIHKAIVRIISWIGILK